MYAASCCDAEINYFPCLSGPAAEKQAEQKLIEQLAAEVEANSSTALRSMWKWTCYQVNQLGVLQLYAFLPCPASSVTVHT